MPRKQLNLANFKCCEPFCAARVLQSHSYKLKPIILIILTVLSLSIYNMHACIHPLMEHLAQGSYKIFDLAYCKRKAEAKQRCCGRDKEDQKDRLRWVKTEHEDTPRQQNELSLL